jgi:hypothetical protein
VGRRSLEEGGVRSGRTERADDRRTTLEKQLAADALTPDTLKARQLLALGRRESK